MTSKPMRPETRTAPVNHRYAGGGANPTSLLQPDSHNFTSLNYVSHQRYHMKISNP
ncbi:hypothetical protein DSO57_1028465 [Entomophthora muscae]|uniref:Uncharacterized protein n=1 Tax=Entomophthora muscae TaxID=34485 RepID=A0ACC2SQP7_9FUNG|nr:hypothetical protein DSO57_1028465 [Entomophthora muscae]